MPFLLLMVVVVACLVQFWQEPPFEAPVAFWAVFSCTPIIAVLSLTLLLTRRLRRGLLRLRFQHDQLLHVYGVFRSYQIFFLIAAYFLTVYGLGWGWVVEQLATVDDPRPVHLVPGAELLLLLPFLVGLLASWACYYDVERTIQATSFASVGPTTGGRLAYVAFHARQNLALVVAPLTLLVLGLGLARQFPTLHNDNRFVAASFGMTVSVFICLPWLLRLVLGLRPLPPGPLRERLMATARRLRFRFSDILLWNTQRCVANAMVVGVLPIPRYVVLSDRLVEGLTDDEIEAVFGHEVGHVKHFHMPYYLGFLLVSFTVLVQTWGVLADAIAVQVPAWEAWLKDNSDLPLLPLLPVIGLYIFVVFGFLSRRCERQADIYGCRAVSCGHDDCGGHEVGVDLVNEAHGLCATGIRTFIQALEKVALLNGISRSKPGWLQSWQHSTIARRVEFLQHVLKDPGLERRFQKRVGQVKWAMFAGLATVLALLCVI